MKRECASEHEARTDGPASSEQLDEWHDRKRQRQHAETEIRRRDPAAASVLVLIEETETRRQDEKGSSDHHAPHPPAVS